MESECISGVNLMESKTGQKILFRENEISFIKRYMGYPSSFPYPSLLIYGHTTTGKTLVVLELMKSSNVPYVWINCHESCNAQSLFAKVIQVLCPGDTEKKINNMHEFLNFLRIKLKEAFETTYLIFDCAEVLRKEDPFLLSVLLKLQMLTTVNICTIFISELPWRAFRSQVNCFDPISLHFQDYSKDQIAEILTLDCPPEHTVVFYKSYVNVIMKTFFILTTNISELRHLAEINFEKYCEPLQEDDDIEVSSFRLWKNIEPTLKEAMGSVYLREISSSKWKAYCSTKDQNSENKCSIITLDKFSATRELPFYSKFLLLAAYFASYNPPKSDFRHFVKNQGKQAKKRITKKVEKNRHLLGPKPFTLDRMLSIFFSIVGEKVLPSSLIFSQISSLVQMRLMSRVSTDEHLDCPKYKCLAELDLVSKIGKTISIDVMGYLDDFL
ncbi:origin recognition complex subunit 5-like [Argiope bruennichi]|uniref:Origin recognition complex subunit 5 like protein n=1 Tax=Argiope bruennichi TaxID=94029 RepID=A0A8T0FV27_ARGBR|nr:origin recognition complex subunit 5-like [Argiope bruennichi]KAF8794957.1 Origin recognition complex subunit 5 like protein [Argiope bruennichi]